jgi:hypothetical protein
MKRIATVFLLALLVGGFCVTGAHATVSRGLDCRQCHSFSNQRPVANAGADQTVNPASSATLNGSGSSDADDGIAPYQWRQISGPSVRLSRAAYSNASFTAPQVDSRGATLTFELTVKDRAGLSTSDTVSVSVSRSGDDDDDDDEEDDD